MNKYFTNILLVIAFAGLIFSMPEKAHGNEKTSVRSAVLASTSTIVEKDNRAQILRAYLAQYDSPLVDSAETFIEEADRNNLDWKLVVSISGVESWFGHRIPYQSNNGWGWGVYGDKVTRFASWDEGITIISHSLRTKYMNKWGATNVTEIGRIYAADPAWAQKVTSFMNKIEKFEKTYELAALPISI